MGLIKYNPIMSRLFVGKLQHGDQLEKNYYRYEGTDEKARDHHFSGLKEGDYVLPIKRGVVEKLYRFKEFQQKGHIFDAVFEELKRYDTPLSLGGNILNCRYFHPDMNLLNKAIKATKGVGFFPLSLVKNCPDIPEIDFEKSKRRFFFCLPEKLKDQSFFRPYDICVVLDSPDVMNIKDILIFNGQSFDREEVFWKLYLEKTNNGDEQYSLRELLDFAAPKKDDAPKKLKYISALGEEILSDGIFLADNPIALYDNVIVGRKQSAPSSARKQQSPDNIEIDTAMDENEDDEEGIIDLTDYKPYAELMRFNPNIILHGPPGTGKTYGAMRIIEAFEEQNGQPCKFKQVEAQGRVKFITFHQAFSYEEFVEGIRPEPDDDGNMTYQVKPGILQLMADSCRLNTQGDPKNSSKPYYLIIDEINRGNIAKIFGELITLIEKDKRETLSCTLAYSRKSFSLPNNLYLIGTMNTSDRSIALLDTALRRRFAFIELNPDVSIVENEHPSIGGNVSPSRLLQELNNRITDKIDRDHRIGHSYFLGDDLVNIQDLFNVWYYKILPLLMEYFYNDINKAGEITGDDFFDKKTGEVKQLSLKPNDNGISDFEAALIRIYDNGN